MSTDIFAAMRIRMEGDFTWLKLPLYYLVKFFGLAPFVLKNNKFYPAGFLGKAYTVAHVALLTTLSVMSYVYGFQSTRKDRLEIIVLILLKTLTCGRLCTALFTLAFESEEAVDILNKMNAIEDEINSFDSTQTRGAGNWKAVSAKIMVTNFIVMCLNLFELGRTYRTDHVIIACCIWIGRFAIKAEVHITAMIFVESLIRIKRNFQLLNEHLRDILRPAYEALPSCSNIENSPIFPAGGQHRQFPVQRFERIRILHRELCELVESVTNLMGVPILVAGAQYVVHLLFVCFSIYTIASTSDSTSAENIVQSVWSFAPRVAITLFELILIADACSSACATGDATNGVLIELWNMYHPQEVYDEFFMFSLQLLHHPLSICAFGFLNLDYSFIYKIACAVVTYLVIMVQLDGSQSIDRGA